MTSENPTPSRPLNLLIVDDEEPAREELRWLLEQCDGARVVGTAASAEAALKVLDAGDGPAIDLVFLDINMPGIDGMRLAESLQKMGAQRGTRRPRPGVIFVTAYDHYAVDAFGVDAIDYLLKPVRLARLQKALERARALLQPAPSEPAAQETILERISVEDHGVYRVLPVDEILYFESDGGVVVAATLTERFITDFSLKFLEENLSPRAFFRCHRSYIVRLDAIESIAPWGAGTYRLIVSRERDLGAPLSRSRAAELKSRIPWSARAIDG
ncbi:LytR/AlgR family response regulator transcription factor [Bradymonas sediminis]|uniref:DNA-binding response regulator n=1 Tax=Bradymonas sediminis TaxID=1548548 RepID=A0A2Z4FPI9_9DELT|nr:LytTR family DNA-binding domain-containing protein [Bradymonas sediminis]AWV90665.1 DNA-binding response regulator [Bradymonas sediminis]TDP62697.1 LytTR family two component transcriptional regulator [Bradymonas sediminis]